MSYYTPGTVIPYDDSLPGMFHLFHTMIKAADGLSSAQICAITGMEYSTLQNWVKRGFVAHPVAKKYFDNQLARILIINALRDCLKLDMIIDLLKMVNGDLIDESDDIIPESKLYDYLCIIVHMIDTGGISHENIQNAIAQVTAEYSGPTPDSKQRITRALSVMAYAYVSGKMKEEAELIYQQLKEGV